MSLRQTIALVALLAPLLGSRCGAPEPIRLGVALGSEGVAMARFAVADVNRAGGIGGQPLEMVLEGEASTSSAAPALEAAARLARDPAVLAVVGHANSSATLAASQIYNAQRLPQLAPTSSSPILSGAGPYTFQLVASDVHQGRFLARQLLRCAPGGRVALLYVNDDYGRWLEDIVRRSLVDAGMAPVYEAPVGDDDSFAGEELARAIAAAQPDVVVWLARAPSLTTLMPPLRRLLPSVRVLASDGVESVQVARGGDPNFVGVRYVRFIPQAGESPALADLERRFRARHPEMQLTGLAVLTYDSIMLLADALRSGARTRDAVRDHLASLGTARTAYPGLSGPISFDSTGAAVPRYRLAEVTETGLRPAESCGTAP